MWYNGAEGSQNVEYMDTSDTPWYWYYLEDCGRWHRFEDDPDSSLSSEDVERQYLRDPKGVVQTFSSTGGCKTDFSAMLQTNLTTGRQKRIQRSQDHFQTRCSCFSSVPVFWEMVDPKLPYQLICLNEDTAEYQTVADFVKTDGMLDKHILSISRIQNLDLWELYCRKKKQLLRIQDGKEIKEKRLFHGTKTKNVHTICTYNFDFRLAGNNGHLFGKGTYFARHATYADNYSHLSADPLPLYDGALQGVQGQQSKIIFVARVMIGKSKVGQKCFQKPDHDSSTNDYDSCVDDIKHPKIFVVFDPNQIYPEYLIQYC